MLWAAGLAFSIPRLAATEAISCRCMGRNKSLIGELHSEREEVVGNTKLVGQIKVRVGRAGRRIGLGRSLAAGSLHGVEILAPSTDSLIMHPVTLFFLRRARERRELEKRRTAVITLGRQQQLRHFSRVAVLSVWLAMATWPGLEKSRKYRSKERKRAVSIRSQ